MISIKLRANVFIDQKPYFEGETVEVTEAFARVMVGAGRAEYVTATPAIETAVVEAPEKAVVNKKSKKR